MVIDASQRMPSLTAVGTLPTASDTSRAFQVLL